MNLGWPDVSVYLGQSWFLTLCPADRRFSTEPLLFYAGSVPGVPFFFPFFSFINNTLRMVASHKPYNSSFHSFICRFLILKIWSSCINWKGELGHMGRKQEVYHISMVIATFCSQHLQLLNSFIYFTAFSTSVSLQCALTGLQSCFLLYTYLSFINATWLALCIMIPWFSSVVKVLYQQISLFPDVKYWNITPVMTVRPFVCPRWDRVTRGGCLCAGATCFFLLWKAAAIEQHPKLQHTHIITCAKLRHGIIT